MTGFDTPMEFDLTAQKVAQWVAYLGERKWQMENGCTLVLEARVEDDRPVMPEELGETEPTETEPIPDTPNTE